MTLTFGTPFGQPTDEPEPTERQINYLVSLCSEYAELLTEATPESEPVTGHELSTPILNASLSRAAFSRQIDQYKTAVTALREARNERRAADANRITEADSLAGFWMVDGQPVKVQLNLAGTREYGKLFIDGTWTYQGGLVNQVKRTGVRMTLEQAAEHGHLYGRCIACGRRLTDENSIAAGIGPICAQAF